NALSLSSILVTSVYGFDESKSNVGPVLAYTGAGVGVVAFTLVASGLSLQHSALGEVGADPGRGLFAAGTTLGVFGLLSVGASYVFALAPGILGSDGANTSRTVAFATSIAGTALM